MVTHNVFGFIVEDAKKLGSPVLAVGGDTPLLALGKPRTAW